MLINRFTYFNIRLYAPLYFLSPYFLIVYYGCYHIFNVAYSTIKLLKVNTIGRVSGDSVTRAISLTILVVHLAVHLVNA